jgi:hypothetical protein
LLLSERFFVDYLLGYELAVMRGSTKFHDAILAGFLPFCEKDLGESCGAGKPYNRQHREGGGRREGVRGVHRSEEAE